MKSIKFIILALFSLPLLGITYEWIAAKIDSKRFPPTGKLVDMGDYKLHIRCMGEGNHSVIMDAGLGLNSLEWSLVQPEVAKFAKAYSFDRAGYGWSDGNSYPRTSMQTVKELHALLEKVKAPKPYLLVGHSLGGLNMQLFAATYPNEVMGMVLVDACHEDQTSRLPKEPEIIVNTKKLLNSKLLPLMSQTGVSRFFALLPNSKKTIEGSMKGFSKEVIAQYKAKIQSHKVALAFIDENKRFDESLAELRSLNWSFGNKPLIVITAGKMEQEGLTDVPKEWFAQTYEGWIILQKELAAKSTKGKQIFATDSNHMITRNQPQIIVNAIKEILTNSSAESDQGNLVEK